MTISGFVFENSRGDSLSYIYRMA